MTNEKASESTEPCEASKPYEWDDEDQVLMEEANGNSKLIAKLQAQVDALTQELSEANIAFNRLVVERDALNRQLWIDGKSYRVAEEVYVTWLKFVKLYGEVERLRTALRSAPQWIKTSERLPMQDQIVLVSGGIAQYRNEWFFTGMEDPRFQRIIQWPVTHWMPLIFAPEESASLEAAGTQDDDDETEGKIAPEDSPAVKKAMARFHKRLAEVQAEAAGTSPQPKPLVNEAGLANWEETTRPTRKAGTSPQPCSTCKGQRMLNIDTTTTGGMDAKYCSTCKGTGVQPTQTGHVEQRALHHRKNRRDVRVRRNDGCGLLRSWRGSLLLRLMLPGL